MCVSVCCRFVYTCLGTGKTVVHTCTANRSSKITELLPHVNIALGSCFTVLYTTECWPWFEVTLKQKLAKLAYLEIVFYMNIYYTTGLSRKRVFHFLSNAGLKEVPNHYVICHEMLAF